MNPRIQVEHTVTEEVTDVDLVQSQMRIASGETLEDLGLRQDADRLRGAALQCRITTEDPANGFRPDTGKITTYRSPGGAGIRLDGGTTYTGAEVSAHFDSMLAKLTCRGRDFATAVRARAPRGGGVPHPRRLDEHPVPAGGARRPGLPAGRRHHRVHRGPPAAAHRAVVRRPRHQAAHLPRRRHRQPAARRRAGHASTRSASCPTSTSTVPAPDGSRQALLALGPEGFARALREQQAVAVTDTTFRDAHQSLLATRVRTRDLLAVAGHVARHDAAAVVARGVGRGDVRRGAAVPVRGPLGAARQAAAGGAEHLPADAAARPQHGRLHAVPDGGHRRVRARGGRSTGIDVFRIFDALNDVEQMRPAIEAVRDDRHRRSRRSRSATPATCPIPDEKLYTLDYYLGLAERIVDAGAHVLAIKDMAGLLRAPAARTLVTALRERFDLPVHLHTHDTPGGQLATLLAAIDAGVDAVDAASASMAGTTSQPRALGAGRRPPTTPTGRPGSTCEAVCELEPYWEATRRVYAPFESGLPSPTGRVYRHEIPGGQLSNLRQQAIALGLGEKFEQIEDMYAAANDILGNIVKVTPSSKVVGDLALHLVAVGADPTEFEETPQKFDIPDSVIGFLSGELGDPPGGWPEPFRTKALEGRTWKPAGRRARRGAAGRADGTTPRPTLNELLFPGPTQGVRRVARDVRRRVGAADHGLPLRPAQRRGARGRPRGGQAADPRAAGRSARPTSAASAR